MTEDLISRKALIEKMFPYGMPDGGNYGINARAVMEALTKAESVEVRGTGDMISRSALLEEYEWLKSQVNPCSVAEVEEHIARIRRIPAVEAEPVVRCAECMNYYPDSLSCRAAINCDGNWYPEDFCSYGAKMKDEVVDG